ncbi:Aste57867_10464 [Aphanomyces stellatus]|uniref:Aste57867_10464 protein n=1 Tax=Aphanomyces stellatus TaxID=120398 RepID=A0A485KQX2_9STRA|nr:hypothetical protein As57867_010424 [Aphanomyces stellatus]VFT87338.1 Aste57867_10464 [Aphanomyces stellatus]
MASIEPHRQAKVEKTPLLPLTSIAKPDGTNMGPLDPYSTQALCLYCQYAAIGIIYAMLPALSYPIFNVYLNLEGYQTASYSVLVTLGWSFKVFFGMLSDCVPIFGYRRKSWILIGWAITIVCLAALTALPFGTPYCNREKTTYCATPRGAIPPTELQYFNFHAPDRGSLFILLSMAVSVGYMLAGCATDAILVEYAQREPLATRGRLQTTTYTIRYGFGVISLLVTGIGLNGVNYNGSFSFAISPNWPYAFCLLPCVVVCYTTLVYMDEPPTSTAASFRAWCRQFWALLQERVMWQLCAFRFVSELFHRIGATPQAPIATYWAQVEPINDACAAIIGHAFFAAMLAIVGRYGLHWNWRWTMVVGIVGTVALDALVMMLTIWDVVRNQWFYTGVALSEQIPLGLRFVVSTFCAVEIADVGNEGATYGLVTMVSSLAQPLASMVFKLLDSYFAVAQDDIKRDTLAVRWDVTYVYLISYASKLGALGWLWMLPPQKEALQHLKVHGGRSRVAGGLLIVVFVFTVILSVTSNLLSIFPTTKCYRIAGGNGVVGPDGHCRM